MQSVRAGRALVPEQHRVHPPHQRPRLDRGRARDRVRRQLPGDGPGRRLPRRAGGHAARPAPPAGHHQVQPGAHLDRRRTRSASAAPTCASTAWKARAATSSSAARCRCGTATARPRRLRRQALAAALLRPDPLLPGRATKSCCGSARDFPPGRYPLRHRGDDLPPGATTSAFLAEQPRRDRTPSGSGSRRRSTPSASAGTPPARSHYDASSPRPAPTRRARPGRERAAAVDSHVAGNVWQVMRAGGQASRRGRHAADPRVDEDGNPRCTAPLRRHGSATCCCAAGGRVGAGQALLVIELTA